MLPQIRDRQKEDGEEYDETLVVRVLRCNLYPSRNPTCGVIAFEARNKLNNRSKYFETCIPIDDIKGKDDWRTVQAGWFKVREDVAAWNQDVRKQDPLLGAVLSERVLDAIPEEQEEAVVQEDEDDDADGDDRWEEDEESVQK